MREFISCLLDALKEGDLAGHLAAWWRVVTRQVGPDDTASCPIPRERPEFPAYVGWDGREHAEF